ncbi:MAG: hypothetical protein ABF301_04245 [Sulfurovum sp.]|jgi:uncharacterized lipoprotein YehR (DUF1307 family)
MKKYFISTVYVLAVIVTFTACEQKEVVEKVSQNINIGVYNGEDNYDTLFTLDLN